MVQISFPRFPTPEQADSAAGVAAKDLSFKEGKLLPYLPGKNGKAARVQGRGIPFEHGGEGDGGMLTSSRLESSAATAAA